MRDSVRWFLLPDHPLQVPPTVPVGVGEVLVPPLAFGAPRLGLGRRGGIWTEGAPAGAYGSSMDQIRYAARNRLLAQVNYHGVSRLVEPYSLRRPGTGNLLLYVYEIERGGRAGEGIKAFMVAELGNTVVTEKPFRPRYLVEL